MGGSPAAGCCRMVHGLLVCCTLSASVYRGLFPHGWALRRRIDPFSACSCNLISAQRAAPAPCSSEQRAKKEIIALNI
jgi:hypothetical protein